MYIKNPNYDPNDPNSKRYIPDIMSHLAYQDQTSYLQPVTQQNSVIKQIPIQQPQPQQPVQQAKPQPQIIPTSNKSGVKLATLYSPDGKQKNVVEVGSQKASQLLSQGYTLTPQAKPTVTVNEKQPEDKNIALANLAAKAGMGLKDFLSILQQENQPTSQDETKIKNELGIPELVTEAFKKPEKTTVERYKELYELSGLPDLKNKIAQKTKEIETRRKQLVQAVGALENNPWLSQATRTGRLRILNELAQADINNLINEKNQLLDLYDQGVGEIEKNINYEAKDLEKDRQLTVSKLNYLLGEAEKAYEEKKNEKGRQILRYIPDFLKASTQTDEGLSDKDLITQASNLVKNGQADNLSQAISMIRDIQAGGTGSKGIVGGYDISSYATDPAHEQRIQQILNQIGKFNTLDEVQAYINRVAPGSPITAQMISNTSAKYGVPWEMLVAMMQQDSSLGTAGKGARTFNPGNIGNDDAGNLRNYGNWQAGVDAVGAWLSKHKVGETNGSKDLQTELNKLNPQDRNIVKAIMDGTYKVKDIRAETRERIAGALNSAGFKQAVSAQMKQQVASIKDGLKDLAKLWDDVPDRYKGKLQGWFAEKLGAEDWNKKVAKFNTAQKLIGMQITRLFEKGRLSDQDRIFYLSLMPNLQQNKETAEASTKEMIRRLEAKVADIQNNGILQNIMNDDELAKEYDNL